MLYGAAGEVPRRTSYEVDQVGSGNKSFVFDSLNDSLGRVTKVTNQGKDGDITQTSDNGVTVTYYDALSRRTKVTDAESVSTAWLYDGLGRMTRQTEDFGGINRHIDSAYDQAGRMTRITDDLGQNTDYVYDPRGRLTNPSYAVRLIFC